MVRIVDTVDAMLLSVNRQKLMHIQSLKENTLYQPKPSVPLSLQLELVLGTYSSKHLLELRLQPFVLFEELTDSLIAVLSPC